MPVPRSLWSGIGRLSRDETFRLQSAKLREFLTTQVHPFSDHYRRLFAQRGVDVRRFRDLRDLRHYPFTTKADLAPTDTDPRKHLDFVLKPDAQKIREHWPLARKLALLARRTFSGEDAVTERLRWEYAPVLMTATTGRSARQVAFMYTRYDLALLSTIGGRLIELLGIGPDERAINMFPYAPHLAFWAVALGGMGAGVFILSTGGGKVMGTAGNIAAIERMQPSLLLGVPGFVYHLLRTALADGRNFSSVRLVVLGAEKVPDGMKERMREALMAMGARDPRIVGTYGFTEAKSAWGECPTPLGVSSGYHTHPDTGLFEIVNPETGETCREGEDGEIVYTSLDFRGSVVIRYRTGDFARGGLTCDPCPHCGLTVPRINSTITRASNVKEVSLTKVKGTLIDLNALALVMASMKEIEEWQIELRKRGGDPFGLDEVVVYVAPRAGAAAGLDRLLRDRLVAETEVAPNEVVQLTLPEMLARLGMETELKEKRILDSRPAASAAPATAAPAASAEPAARAP
jgi:phenylacetate-coenzyme A ligase PaaK-like adenylate-forming protein